MQTNNENPAFIKSFKEELCNEKIEILKLLKGEFFEMVGEYECEGYTLKKPLKTIFYGNLTLSNSIFCLN